ncbi:MAG: hypothetical protein AAFN77_06200 [Planctomycetota bacterium]
MISSASTPKFQFLLLTAIALTSAICHAELFAQAERKKSPTDTAVLKGKVEFAKDQAKSYTGETLEIEISEIQARLREYVDLPAPKTPRGFERWTSQQKLKWQQEFVNSEAGKKHIERNKKLLADANSFDIKFENDGSYAIYDVPPGDYAIQGRVDKEIGKITYAFEVFGQLTVQKEVDELALAPIQIEVTPQLKQGDTCPPIAVLTHDDKATLKRETFKDAILFVNFWSKTSPTATAEQAMVQKMYASLKSQYKLRLLSVNVDANRKEALKFLLENKLREGSHGFTDGMQHKTLFHFGVRGVPSYWLVSGDGKIMMSQYEMAQAMRLKPDLKTIVSDRIEGKDTPTLAPKPDEKASDK